MAPLAIATALILSRTYKTIVVVASKICRKFEF
jgi:hypothetical protein